MRSEWSPFRSSKALLFFLGVLGACVAQGNDQDISIESLAQQTGEVQPAWYADVTAVTHPFVLDFRRGALVKISSVRYSPFDRNPAANAVPVYGYVTTQGTLTSKGWALTQLSPMVFVRLDDLGEIYRQDPNTAGLSDYTVKHCPALTLDGAGRLGHSGERSNTLQGWGEAQDYVGANVGENIFRSVSSFCDSEFHKIAGELYAQGVDPQTAKPKNKLSDAKLDRYFRAQSVRLGDREILFSGNYIDDEQGYYWSVPESIDMSKHRSWADIQRLQSDDISFQSYLRYGPAHAGEFLFRDLRPFLLEECQPSVVEQVVNFCLRRTTTEPTEDELFEQAKSFVADLGLLADFDIGLTRDLKMFLGARGQNFDRWHPPVYGYAQQRGAVETGALTLGEAQWQVLKTATDRFDVSWDQITPEVIHVNHIQDRVFSESSRFVERGVAVPMVWNYDTGVLSTRIDSGGLHPFWSTWHYEVKQGLRDASNQRITHSVLSPLGDEDQVTIDFANTASVVQIPTYYGFIDVPLCPFADSSISADGESLVCSRRLRP